MSPPHFYRFCFSSEPATAGVIRVTWITSRPAPIVCLRLLTLVLPAGLMASLLVILVPMPAALMDLLLSANIAIAVVLLLTTVYVRTPLEFSVFPSLLLATTLGRLVLNIATTRLILTRADVDGLDAAGGVVRTFGEFVAGDRLVVGLIIFLIIIVIQFVVITKGAMRISEVAARFALDGMPGRQMAIDADLNAGMIDEKQAQRRVADVTRQADFFGAMDGASKFVRGDAIAGIVIIIVNIVGGLFVGVVESGMNLASAASIFTRLTIGDGLVTQVPALDFVGGGPVGHAFQRRDRSAGNSFDNCSRVPRRYRHGRLPGTVDLYQPAAGAAVGHRGARPVCRSCCRDGVAKPRPRPAQQASEAKKSSLASSSIWPSIPWRSKLALA